MTSVDASWQNPWVVKAFALGLLMLAACAADTQEPAAPPSPSGVSIHGLIDEFTFGTACDEANGRRLIWYDGEDTVIGTVTSTRDIEQDAEGHEGVCRIADSYEIEVPRADFYRVEVENIPLGPEPVSFEELEAMDFEYNLTIDDS